MVTVAQIFKIGLVIPKCVLVVLLFVINNVMKRIAPNMMLKKFKDKKKGKMNMEVKSLDDVAYIFSWDMVKARVSIEVGDILKEAQLGEDAPNPELYDLVKGETTFISNLAKPGRSMVINFGSCT